MTDQPPIGGVLATAGVLVFTGKSSGDSSAFDADNGRKLWSFHCGAGVNVPTATYEQHGKQHVAVATESNALFVFRLPRPCNKSSPGPPGERGVLRYRHGCNGREPVRTHRNDLTRKHA